MRLHPAKSQRSCRDNACGTAAVSLAYTSSIQSRDLYSLSGSFSGIVDPKNCKLTVTYKNATHEGDDNHEIKIKIGKAAQIALPTGRPPVLFFDLPSENVFTAYPIWRYNEAEDPILSLSCNPASTDCGLVTIDALAQTIAIDFTDFSQESPFLKIFDLGRG